MTAIDALRAVRPIIVSLIDAEQNVESWGLKQRLAAIDAALSALPPPCDGVGVKELQWPDSIRRGQRVESSGGLLSYTIAHYGGSEPDSGVVYRWAVAEGPWSEAFFAYEHAIAAAQSDYDRRVRSALAPVAAEPVASIEAYYERQIEWSKNTFGPALHTKGILDHIRKELSEIEAEPQDLSEWVDVVILAMDGFWRHGGAASGLMPALLAKQVKNFARQWPDWRTMSEDRAIEHDRGADASPVPAAVDTGKRAADQIIGQIEDRFPNWRSYRDLIDCIDCTLHDLRASTPTSDAKTSPVDGRETEAVMLNLSAWCDEQAALRGAVDGYDHWVGEELTCGHVSIDGYDYRSGQKAAYRHVSIEATKRARSWLSSHPQTDEAKEG